MARVLRSARRSAALLKTLIPDLTPPLLPLARSYIAEMRHSAFRENLLRILRTEIQYESEYRPPREPPARFGSFSVEDRPGEQWVRLRRAHRGDGGGAEEEVKVDATMFDGAAPVPEPLPKRIEAYEAGARLHISLIVEVSKGEASDHVLNFVCSAWPEALDVEKVFPVRRGGDGALRPYMGRDFKELDDELQNAVREYLEERGVNDDLAEFLHDYMANKDKTELIQWLRTVESYVKK